MQMEQPVCLYIYRHPIEHGMRLEGSRKNHNRMTAERWIRMWEQGAPAAPASTLCSARFPHECCGWFWF